MKKKITTVFAMGALSVIALFGATACGGSVTSISVSKNNVQTVFVKGQELDLSNGTIIVDGGNTVSLSDPDVSVTGYDKDTVGKQTLTITYKGATTTLNVECVERIAPDSRVVANYFVGDTLSFAGTLYVTSDDGEVDQVAMKSNSLSFEYDFSTANESTPVTVTYTSGTTTYTGSFTVGVYEATSIAIKSNPTKTNYKNYDTLDLTGAKLSLKNTAKGLSKEIEITEDMIGAYDFTTITKAEKTKQMTIPVSYGGKDMSFKVNVTYTEVLNIKKTYDELAENAYVFDPNYMDLDISDTDGEKALAAVESYLDLTATDKAFIGDEVALYLVRVASVYGYKTWKTGVDSYSDLVTVSESGSVSLTRKDHSATVTAYESYTQSSEGSAFVTLGERLVVINESFGMEELFKVTTGEEEGEDTETIVLISELLAPAATYARAIQKVAHALELYALFDVETVDGAVIDSAFNLITATEYNTLSDRDVYSLLSSWDEDFFDQIYAYYYGDGTNVDETSIMALKEYALPTALEEIYVAMRNAIIQVNYTNNLARNDRSLFMLFYTIANEGLKVVNANAEKEDATTYEKMCGYLANNLEFENIVSQRAYPLSTLVSLLVNYSQKRYQNQMGNNVSIGGGYIYVMGNMYENSDVIALWDEYLDFLIDIYNGVEREVYMAKIPALLEKYASLSPEWQYGFLGSVNGYYQRVSGYQYAWSSTSTNNFTSYILNYYYNLFEVSEENEDGQHAYTFVHNVLYLSEILAQGNEESFVQNWKKYAVDQYEGLKDSVTFDSTILGIYNQYNAIYNYIVVVGSAIEEEEIVTVYSVKDMNFDPEFETAVSAKFVELTKAIYSAYSFNNYTYQNYQMLAYLSSATLMARLSQGYALQMYAEKLASEFLATATQAEKIAYYYNTFFPITEVKVNGSLDQILYASRTYFATLLKNAEYRNGNNTYYHWVFFRIGNVKEIYTKFGELLNKGDAYTATEMTNFIKYLDEMDSESMSAFRLIDTRGTIFSVIQSYFNTMLGENNKAVGDYLVNALYYDQYFKSNPEIEFNDGTTARQQFFGAIFRAKSAYSALTVAEKTEFDEMFSALYTYFVGQLPTTSSAVNSLLAVLETADKYWNAYMAQPDGKEDVKTFAQLFDETMLSVFGAYDELGASDKEQFDFYFFGSYKTMKANWDNFFSGDEALKEIKQLLVLTEYYSTLKTEDPDKVVVEGVTEWKRFSDTIALFMNKYEALTEANQTLFGDLFASDFETISNFYTTYFGNESATLNVFIQTLYRANVYWTAYGENPYGAYGATTYEDKVSSILAELLTAYEALTEADKTALEEMTISYKALVGFANHYFVLADAEVANVAKLVYTASVYFNLYVANPNMEVTVGGETKLLYDVMVETWENAKNAYEALSADKKVAFEDATDGNDRASKYALTSVEIMATEAVPVLIAYQNNPYGEYAEGVTNEAKAIEICSVVLNAYKNLTESEQKQYDALGNNYAAVINNAKAYFVIDDVELNDLVRKVRAAYFYAGLYNNDKMSEVVVNGESKTAFEMFEATLMATIDAYTKLSETAQALARSETYKSQWATFANLYAYYLGEVSINIQMNEEVSSEVKTFVRQLASVASNYYNALSSNRYKERLRAGYERLVSAYEALTEDQKTEARAIVGDAYEIYAEFVSQLLNTSNENF